LTKGGVQCLLEENKAIIRKMVEASNKKDLAMIDEYMALDFVDHSSQVQGRENAKQGYSKVLKDYPDFHRTIEDIIAEGDKIWFLERGARASTTNYSAAKDARLKSCRLSMTRV
jgi:predicted ester cyclase